MDFFVWLEGTSIGTWINQSASIFFGYPGVLLVHTIGMTLLVGIHVAIGLRILGFAPQVPVLEMRKLLPLMWTGLVLSAVSGVLLLIAKATTMIANSAFFIKMLAIVLAVWVFFAMRTKIFGDPLLDEKPMEMNGKVLAFLSLALWLVALTAGRLMAYIGEAAQYGRQF
jgi:hypothetical protein